MIAMLEVLPNEHISLFKKLGYITPRKISAYLVFAGDIQMLRVTHKEHIRGINWKGLEDITDTEHWLLPNGLIPPEKSTIKNFEPAHLPAKLMDNIAVSVLENADIKPSALSVGLYPHSDSNVIEPIIERAREVRVLCDSYNEEFAQNIMDKYGAAVVCGNDEDIFSHCQMVIASGDNSGKAQAFKNALLFSPSTNQRRALHVRSTLPQAPDVYSYPAQLFGAVKTLSALYELENRRELGLITPFLARLEDGLITSPELSRYLKTLAI